MKKLASILVLVFVFTLTTNAQKRDRKGRGENLSVEQKATLAVKKMTLALDLTESQQNQMKPLIANQISDKMATKDKMMAMKESGKRPTDDEKFAFANNNLDKKIAFKKNIKQILNDEQFAKFEKMTKKRAMKKGDRRGKRNSKKRK